MQQSKAISHSHLLLSDWSRADSKWGEGNGEGALVTTFLSAKFEHNGHKWDRFRRLDSQSQEFRYNLRRTQVEIVADFAEDSLERHT